MKCAICGGEFADLAVGCPQCDLPTAKRPHPEIDGRAGEGADRFSPGSVLAGRYRLVYLLGRGGMGEVYRAEDLRLGQQVALKFLSPAREQDPAMRERFLDEVRLARRVSHANVCRVYDVGEAGARLFLSMEYVDGEDLRTLLKRIGRLPRERAAEMSVRICRGLAAIHAQGILHRDLKPSNVMIDGDGQPRLTDFGLAALAESDQGDEVRAGTPAYMAPEQLLGQAATIRSDLYALGLVTWELFTGRRAVPGHPPTELARRHPEGEPLPPSPEEVELDPAVERVVRWCLQKDPRDRPASAEAVEAALVADVGPEPGTFLKTVVASDPAGGAGAEGRERVTRDLLAEHGGREISTAEGPVWLFERPWGAVCFALACHQAPEGGAAAARIGIHLGEVILRRSSRREAAAAGPIVAEGPGVAMARRLSELAREGQTLVTAHAFDLARHHSMCEAAPEGKVRWLSHGNYLLRGHEEAIEIFEVGVEGIAPLAAPESSEQATAVLGQGYIPGWRPAPGATIPQRSHWKIERNLGAGGFGDMWLARHAKTREARVFKFCYDASQLRSLQREITIFRLLKEQLGERPDVTRILDWNFDQAPYFIESEYTAGGSLVEWAEQQGGLDRVPLEVRLEIVAQVATALSAAHSVGVLHKDVKPGNVLIAAGEGGAVRAQLSDFGIGLVTDRDRLAAAGITDAGLTERTEPGSGSWLSGTRLYMAPELLEGEPPTLQADVYALGVVLYQMVVGDFSRALAPGWQREVDDEILREDVAAAVDGSPARRISNALRLAERLRTLASRRAEREAERRARQRAERARRQRRIMAAAIVVLVLLGGAIGAMAWRVAREAERAEREAQAARQVSEFLVELFELINPYSTADPGESRGETITAREILDRGARRLEVEFEDQPEIRARLMNSVGGVYLSLGLYDSAGALIEGALALRRKSLREEHPDVAESLNSLALVLDSRGDYEGAEALYRESLAMRRRLLGDGHPDVAETLKGLAWVLYSKGDYEGAEACYRESLAIYRPLLGDEHLDVAESLNNLALVLDSKGDYQQAEVFHRESLAIYRRLLRDEHPDVAESLNTLADVLRSKGDYQGAEVLLRESLAMRRRLLGDEHPDVATSLNNLALVLRSKGDYQGAEVLLRESLAIYRRLLGDEHPDVATSLNNLARVLHSKGDFEGAEALHGESLAMWRRLLGDEHPNVATSLNNLARVLHSKGDFEGAEALHRESLAMRRRLLGDEHPDVATSLNNLAAVLISRGEAAEAEALIRGALDVYRQTLPTDHWQIPNAESILGASLAGLGRYTEAEPLLVGSYPIVRDRTGERSPNTRAILERLVTLYEAWGKAEKAAEYRALLDAAGGPP